MLSMGTKWEHRVEIRWKTFFYSFFFYSKFSSTFYLLSAEDFQASYLLQKSNAYVERGLWKVQFNRLVCELHFQLFILALKSYSLFMNIKFFIFFLLPYLILLFIAACKTEFAKHILTVVVFAKTCLMTFFWIQYHIIFTTPFSYKVKYF